MANELAKIEGRIRARKLAEEIDELITSEATTLADEPELLEVFYSVLRKVVPKTIEVLPYESRPMTPEEAARFGKRRLMYGEYEGVSVDLVPLPRLQWYCDSPMSDFVKDLRRYLTSRRIQAEQEDEGV